MSGCSNFRYTNKKYPASVIFNKSNKIINVTNSHNQGSLIINDNKQGNSEIRDFCHR
jgi:hypothetical protein